MSKVAYIIVCWNNRPLLEDCLESIYSQTHKNRDIYVIDNASEDDSAKFIESEHPSVKLTKSVNNNGFAKGNNILISQALKDKDVQYIALINTDARIESNWTEKLIDVALNKDRVACMQSLTVDYYDNSIIDSHHIYVGNNLQSVQYGHKQLSNESAYFTCEVQGVNAAASIVTREFIEKQPEKKLFDESFFMYLEDVDVSLRAITMGWHNYFVAGTTAYHMGSASSKKKSSSFAIYYTVRNQPAMVVKNLPIKTLIKCLPAFFINDYHSLRHLRKYESSNILRKYIKGRLIGYLRIPLYLRKRSLLSRYRTINTEFLEAMMKSGGIIQ